MAGCSPSACATCPFAAIEEKLKKKMKEAEKKAAAEKAKKPKAEKA